MIQNIFSHKAAPLAVSREFILQCSTMWTVSGNGTWGHGSENSLTIKALDYNSGGSILRSATDSA